MIEKLKTVIYTCMTVFLAVAILLEPEETFEASIRGINLWLEIVFPSLLPFFIVTELLLAFGIVKFIGVLLEPFMRPLFNVPGAGGVVLGMGLSSGYPSGAKMATRLREEQLLSRIEAERLIAFTNASNPLFIFGAIAVGFFHDPQAGVLIATCHYVACILTGICMRFYMYNNEERGLVRHESNKIRKAIRILHQSRLAQKQPLGKILGEAVMSSITTLCMIGGFIVLFSVINKLLFILGITDFISHFINYGLRSINLSENISYPLISGIFEITLGTQMIAQADDVSLLVQFLFVGIVLAFNGFSIQAQVASIISTSDIRFFPYLLGRFIHIFFAILLTLLLFQPLYANKKASISPHLPVSTDLDSTNIWALTYEWLTMYGPLITLFSISAAILLIITTTYLRN
ncbi:sporulation integral membrane protein YlbJ [Halalkalibacillus halophilus]|uniref:sporulation integral membrane protein YlbJ n=1 Tax=Halalkalibacillus halophilus TaxID=392827 RepID=UPI00041E86D0|nr:sporulation integral membrane protein YlbJ [Halalkalibacillus halophilus]